jgi:pimeloyl-ACP methyl ester carboxylesterase
MLKFIQMPRSAKPSSRRPPQPLQQPEVVNPIWLVKAIGYTILAALVCGYLTLCLLFYQGQWQLILHPTRTSASPPSIGGAPYQLIHFGPDESATPQLTGWWIPAAAGSRYTGSTILFLRGSDGSLADSIPTLSILHNLGINVFAFDYRGYGQSANVHPNQERMTWDAAAAWQYLQTTRAEQPIIPYGTGTGASLATQLAVSHASIPALVLESPHTDLLDVVRRDTPSRILPIGLLFHDCFPLAAPLAALRTPKLLLSSSGEAPSAFRTASDPKLTVELSAPSDALYAQSLSRFLDQYLPPAAIVPSTAPLPTPSR